MVKKAYYLIIVGLLLVGQWDFLFNIYVNEKGEDRLGFSFVYKGSITKGVDGYYLKMDKEAKNKLYLLKLQKDGLHFLWGNPTYHYSWYGQFKNDSCKGIMIQETASEDWFIYGTFEGIRKK